MGATKFLKEYLRMCNYYAIECKNGDSICPFKEIGVAGRPMLCLLEVSETWLSGYEIISIIVETVRKWSEEHPPDHAETRRKKVSRNDKR